MYITARTGTVAPNLKSDYFRIEMIFLEFSSRWVGDA